MKYILLEPRGGLNDSLSQILKYQNIADRMNRKLIVSFKKNFLLEFFEEFFYFENHNFIYKQDEINEILKKKPVFFPSFITYENYYIIKFKYKKNNNCIFTFNDINVSFDINKKYSEDILVVASCGGGYPISIFKNIRFKDNIKKYIKEKYNLVPKKYESIQVRNTDYICNYQDLINKINLNNNIYIATDSVEVINFFKKITNKIYNFTKFSKILNSPLHSDLSKLDNKIVLRDLFTDIFFLIMSDKIYSNSKGGFINLIRGLYDDTETKIYFKSLIE